MLRFRLPVTGSVKALQYVKKLPRKTKQWAEEAYAALDVAWGLLREEHPNPTEDEKLELIGFAPAIAGTNRGITDRDSVQEAYAFVFDRLEEDLRRSEEGESLHLPTLFLLGYLDAHISFGVLSERKAEEIMEHLSEHYDIGHEP